MFHEFLLMIVQDRTNPIVCLARLVLNEHILVVHVFLLKPYILLSETKQVIDLNSTLYMHHSKQCYLRG